MRLITLNLWGTRGAWADRRGLLRDEFAELRPDLLSLQETVVTDGYDQVREVLGDGFHVIHSKHREADGQGVSIASRWPLSRTHELDLNVTDRTADFACTTLIAEIDAPFGPLLLVNHFPSYELQLEAEREAQAVLAARAIEELATHDGMSVVVAGDLDADPEAASIRFWTGRQSLGGFSVCYLDAWESAHPSERGDTFSPHNELRRDNDWPFRRIDYVLVRCGHDGPTLAIGDCRRILDQPRDGVWASDHFGLVADFEPREQY